MTWRASCARPEREVSRKGVQAVIRNRPLLIDDFAKFIAESQRDRESTDRTFTEGDDDMSLWARPGAV